MYTKTVKKKILIKIRIQTRNRKNMKKNFFLIDAYEDCSKKKKSTRN